MKSIKAIVGSRDTVTIDRLASVSDAARLMTDRKIGAVPVLDDGRVVGVFSERDVMGRVVAAALDPLTTLVGDVMSTDLVVADIAEGSDACRQRMQQVGVRHLLVLAEGRLAGMLSLRDLLVADLDEKDQEITLLNAYVHYIPADIHSNIRR
jgi:CBS domain-containing protein